MAYLNHPDNPTDTAIPLLIGNYGRFGGFFKTEIPAGGSKVIQARMVVAGMWRRISFKKAANTYTGKNAPTPKTTLKPAENAKAEPKAAKPAAPPQK